MTDASLRPPRLVSDDTFPVVGLGGDPRLHFHRGKDLNDFGEPIAEAIFTNYNDGMTLEVDSGSLVGRLSPGRGLAEAIYIEPPFYLEQVNGRILLRFTGEVAGGVHLDVFDVFYPPSLTIVSGPGLSVLTPTLFTVTDFYYQPTVATTIGRVLFPVFFDNDLGTFLAPTITQTGAGLQVALYTDAGTFPVASIGLSVRALTVALHTDLGTFPSPIALARNLRPALHTDAGTVFTPTVTRGVGIDNLIPALYTDAGTFPFNHFLTLHGALRPPVISEVDTFPDPSVTAISPEAISYTSVSFMVGEPYQLEAPDFDLSLFAMLGPARYNDVDQFFVPVVSISAAPRVLTPAL